MARWNSCNVVQIAPDASRLWQFDAKSGGFVFSREHRAANGEALPSRLVAKSWSSLWQSKMNVAWLPPESAFLRVIELPKSTFDETLAMVELQLEKLSPMPVTQIVWTMHVMSRASAENLQTVIVVIAARSAVEEFLGKLEAKGYLADRLETPMLDQLEAANVTEDGAWIYPLLLPGQNAALVAWWSGGALRNLSFIILATTGDRAKSLKEQLAQLTWAGELEGWLAAQPKWNLVADPVNAAEWETLLREALNEPVHVAPPLSAQELAAHTAKRSTAAGSRANLLPAEFSSHYHQQFVDRLWLRGLLATGVLYAICLVIYFCAVQLLGYQTHKVESQVAAISNDYTNAIQLKARSAVLKERQDLKYAALDCWKLVAEQLPAETSLQRFSFANGQTLSLYGAVPADDIGKIIDFSDSLRKVKLNGQPVFDENPDSGEQLVYRSAGNNTMTWNFSLELLHSEGSQ